MFRNYFKIAWRNITHHKAYSALNIAGLSIGMACCILILLWVQNELSYDRFHANANQIYRLTDNAEDFKAAVTPAGMAAGLQSAMPEINATVRISKLFSPLLEVGDRKFQEKWSLYADSNFLQVFSFPLIEGNPKTALQQPDGILITQDMAKKYFGDTDPMGKIIKKDNSTNLVVTGVLANTPSNSHLEFDFIFPMSLIESTNDDLKDKTWDSFNYYTYIELNKNFDATTDNISKLNARIKAIYKQIKFAQNRPIGYNRDGLITIPKSDPNYTGKIDLLRNELLNTGMISGMELSSGPLTQISSNSSDFDWIGKQPREYSFATNNVSYGFGKMVGWKFIAGRDFSTSFATDTNKIIINETAAKDMAFKDPIGQFVKTAGGTKSMQIVGVIKDMIMGSPYEPEKRAIFFLDAKYQSASQIDIKINPRISASTALPKIEAVFKSIVPSAGFDYKFVDEEYAKKFSQEQRIGELSTFFAILAIFISCLGLFGLASFVAEQRTKEIGIRKVIGASVFNIWNLLSKEFIGLVVISLFIACPIAYYFMNNWIQQYTYHTNISWWIFIAAGGGALIITLLTVSFQAIKAALANPVKSLRTE